MVRAGRLSECDIIFLKLTFTGDGLFLFLIITSGCCDCDMGAPRKVRARNCTDIIVRMRVRG